MEDIFPLPLISVIVPVYNTARYLEQCLSSLCSQTLRNIEILCVNDGSTDASEAIIKEFCARDPRVRLVSQPNAGVCEARKNGIRNARGQFIGFVDSDDYVGSDFYECLYAAACREKADVVATCAIFPFDDTGTVFPQKESAYIREKVLSTAEERGKLFLGTGVLWNKVYRKELCQSVAPLYSEKANAAEDNAFSIPCHILAQKIFLVTQPRYFYRQHEASICHQKITTASLQKSYEIYGGILETARRFNLKDSDLRIYRKYILRRRNWDCFQLSEKLPGLFSQLRFVQQTRDVGFQLSWFLRKLRAVCRRMLCGRN